jgi:hypothetical protein
MKMQEYIDEYVAGKLSGDDLIAFERAMSEDMALRSLVDNYHEVRKTSEGILEMELLSEVESFAIKSLNIEEKLNEKINKNHRSETKKINKFLKYALIVLGLAVVLYGIYCLTNKTTQKIESEQIQFADLYESPNWPIKRSQEEDILSIGVNFYLTANKIEEAKRILLDSIEDKSLAKYWVAELYASDMQWDSVNIYLPETIEGWIKNDRILYLQSLSLIHEEKFEEAKAKIEKLSSGYREKLSQFLEREMKEKSIR